MDHAQHDCTVRFGADNQKNIANALQPRPSLKQTVKPSIPAKKKKMPKKPVGKENNLKP